MGLKRTVKDQGTKLSENVGRRDPLYLFACHLEWRRQGNMTAYQELLAALDDCDSDVRSVAEALLHRTSPYREPTGNTLDVW